MLFKSLKKKMCLKKKNSSRNNDPECYERAHWRTRPQCCNNAYCCCRYGAAYARDECRSRWTGGGMGPQRPADRDDGAANRSQTAAYWREIRDDQSWFARAKNNKVSSTSYDYRILLQRNNMQLLVITFWFYVSSSTTQQATMTATLVFLPHFIIFSHFNNNIILIIKEREGGGVVLVRRSVSARWNDDRDKSIKTHAAVLTCSFGSHLINIFII